MQNGYYKKAALEETTSTTLDTNTTIEDEKQHSTKQFMPHAVPNKYTVPHKSVLKKIFKSPINTITSAFKSKKKEKEAKFKREVFMFYTQYRGDKQGKYLKDQPLKAKGVLKNSGENCQALAESEAQPLKQPIQLQINANYQTDGEASSVSSVFSNEHSSRESIPQSSQESPYVELWLLSKQETQIINPSEGDKLNEETRIMPNSRSIFNNNTGVIASVSSIPTQLNSPNQQVSEVQIFRSALRGECSNFTNNNEEPPDSYVSSQPLPPPLPPKNKSSKNILQYFQENSDVLLQNNEPIAFSVSSQPVPPPLPPKNKSPKNTIHNSQENPDTLVRSLNTLTQTMAMKI